MNETIYILGHSSEELRRLELQAKMLEPLTRRLLSETGLNETMSVLDIGTGAGDVAMLAGALVGPKGQVLGIDWNGVALERARARAKHAQLNWVGFDEVDLALGMTLGKFDLVVGRYVLMHQSDPASFLKHAASHVKVGGVVALLEMAQIRDDRFSAPPVAVYDDTVREVISSFRGVRADLDVGSRFVSIFAQAGLPEPSLFSDTLVGGSSSVLPEWIARTRQSIQPGPESHSASWRLLAETIQKAAAASRSQLFGPRNVAAWVRVRGTR
jgi:ubiquinone/menaquinone biosynthesis C-methylase UbiE